MNGLISIHFESCYFIFIYLVYWPNDIYNTYYVSFSSTLFTAYDSICNIIFFNYARHASIDCIHLAWDTKGSCEHCNESSTSKEGRELLD
jgi:hypothetical protein